MGLGVLQLWAGSGPSPANMSVLIPQGATLSQAATELEKAGAIRSARQFVLLARVFGGGRQIKAGEYRLLAGESQSDILKDLQGGKTLQRKITVAEGVPSILVHEALMKADGLSGQVAVPAEGSVLPDTYAYNRGETRAAVLARMQKAMTDYLAQAWARRKPGIAVSTPAQALTLASIVEKETGKPEERRMVAAVYSNRLKQNMMLQADPTIIYPITRGKPLGRRILQSELRAVNQYNTYAMTGLPVGPIANPGRESIDAVLDPAQSTALYFVAKGDGGHVFADTLEQHNANVQKWYALRRARGEM
ncbi:endolytic transglycosylase MltG [Sphingomonas sp. 7/4-4]|uniref:endolytic transglycosylase MltG n=1 Tax=Sphingomonas sp. 7/4-4 TaxID=3018446 RepID=UPI0022F39D57|nr:endolytic transglycosylase MltG [Sphingomonas sp. 7/4-4]WBY08345.1 endolytic transglycosylase MltG [Sphingomonas sp. 7/4-4]